MKKIIEYQTDRLILRQWRDEDKPVFAKMNADPVVMKFYPAVLSAETSDLMALKLQTLIAERGWGLWAIELKQSAEFIGFVGLHKPAFDLPVSPCIEIGWRLARQYWGKGYATEAASAALDVAFEDLGLPQVYSFASLSNSKSIAVMQRLHMVDTQQNFPHPYISDDSPLKEHCLYKIDKQQWQTRR